MIKKSIVLVILTLFTISISSCREESTGDKVEDAVESVADDVEDAVD
ncbi:hypothetical protein JCM19297_1245 [Nonlabens ulvanivorans]|nr:hypothetical protein [Nonlabens ulvanivorans]GAK89417.1 hypothetical protein JCM19297_1245 [Nonlabens ulvanivorans]